AAPRPLRLAPPLRPLAAPAAGDDPGRARLRRRRRRPPAPARDRRPPGRDRPLLDGDRGGAPPLRRLVAGLLPRGAPLSPGSPPDPCYDAVVVGGGPAGGAAAPAAARRRGRGAPR